MGYTKAWKGEELWAALSVHLSWLDDDALRSLQKHFKNASALSVEHSVSSPQADAATAVNALSNKALLALEKFLTIMGIWLSEKLTMSDYRVVLWRERRRNGGDDPNQSSWSDKLCFWCMNPAVIFSKLAKEVRSIVLSSGTLVPLASFASELGTSFPVKLEAPHVISSKQVLVRAISQEGNVKLNCTYRNAESFVMQDALGRSILRFCSIVPQGILCFMPSYAFLERLVRRWKATQAWKAIKKHKHILTEPSRATDFGGLLEQSYQFVNNPRGTASGAIFFAVYRGKASEGIYFSDHHARAVLLVGIPYPNYTDFQVKLKKQYNDSRTCSTQKVGSCLLTGRAWYNLQAYRALNQAAGKPTLSCHVQ